MFVDFREDKPIFDAIRVVAGKLDQRGVFAIQGALCEARRALSDTPIFDVARALDDDRNGLSSFEVETINNGLAAARAGHVALPAVVRGRQIGAAGLELIKRNEGLQLKAYRCPADVWTIGYGHTGPDVVPGLVITEAKADQILQTDLDNFEDAVSRHAPIATANQFDAMVSLAFNIGATAFINSTLLRMHNGSDYRRAAEEFGKWTHGGGRVLPGLMRRRAEEANLYRKGSL